MDSLVTLTFECTTNDAMLMLTCYDIIRQVRVEDSITMQDNAGWLIDEIGSRAKEILDYLRDEGMNVDKHLLDVALLFLGQEGGQ